jgi:hypothetical protein
LLIVLTLSGCGGGGSSNPASVAASDAEETGELVIGLTDAEGDFISYTVDVTAITMQRLDGAIVEALPVATTVDFAELTQVTEFLTVATVPAGVYDSVNLSLDYTNAEILVQNEQGDGIATQVVDETGAPLQQITVELQLTSSDVIRIAPGIPAAFSLDFDLDASNEIDLQTIPATVTVAPFLLATPELETDRRHRLRGLLAETDALTQEITLTVRPFRHRVGRFGEYSFRVTDETAYEIDGQGLTGAEGFEAMAQLSANTPVIALGAVAGGEYSADIVLAGSSVPWTESDVVKGVVSARSGDSLTVRGASIEYTDGLRVIRDTVTVNIGPDTAYSAPGLQAGLLGSQSISVGQRIVAFGELETSADNQSDVANMPVLNALDGRVRLAPSSLLGQVVTADPLVVDLHLLSGRRPVTFDFSGTGVVPETDADPQAYEVATATLPLASVVADELIRVRGFVNEFAAAPADFVARSLITRADAQRPALFSAAWFEPDAMSILRIDDLAVALSLDTARYVLKVFGRSVAFAAGSELEMLTLTAPESASGVYALRVRGEGQIRLFRSFSELTAELLRQSEAGNVLRRVTAHGRYNGDDELETKRATFSLTPAAEQ